MIEANGCYWRGCPTCQANLNKMQETARAKDARRYYFFKQLGFNLHVIWECELKKDPEKVRKALRKLYKNSQ